MRVEPTVAPREAGAPHPEPSRAERTRLALLGAALAVFTDRGYSGASIADVVERAESSVGSLYHHFGGKVDLFLALWQDHHTTQQQLTAAAVQAARQDGVTDHRSLFLAGTRAYLRTAWDQRAVGALFLSGDGPPGFDLVRRENTREWLRANASLLGTPPGPLGTAMVLVLTTTIAEIGREVVTCESPEEAEELIEATMTLVPRFLSDDPLPR